MKTSDILEAAADLIEQRGWCQNRLSDAYGRVCAVGAITAVVAGQGRISGTTLTDRAAKTDQATRALLGVVGSTVIPPSWSDVLVKGYSIPFWNDHPDRTKQEVLDAFRKAAKVARRTEEGLDEGV